jgi:excisionase family DNA binding protein
MEQGSSDGLLSLYLTLTPTDRARRFVRTRRAAELAGVSVRTIVSWIDAGLVETVRIGGRYRVDRQSLQRLTG